MLAGSTCDCLVCRLETHLAAELGTQLAWQGLAIAGDSCQSVASFETPLDLVRALHTPDNPTSTRFCDELLAAILKENARAPAGSNWQRLLLLVFIPTIHRTTTQVTSAFPSLARDDVSQHVLTVFLESLSSAELQTRRSHVAFTIARKLRRGTFRWAIRESRLAPPDNLRDGSAEGFSNGEPLRAETVLERFLDNCQSAGWLSSEDCRLLIEFKIGGVSCRELARRNGHSAVAIQHRIQRVVEKLRRLAQSNPPRQLKLFPQRAKPSGTRGKIF